MPLLPIDFMFSSPFFTYVRFASTIPNSVTDDWADAAPTKAPRVASAISDFFITYLHG